MTLDINQAVKQNITRNAIKNSIVQQDGVIGNNTISKITVSGKTYDLKATTVDFSEKTYDDIFEEMKRRFNIVPIIHHNCHNCGGQLELREDEHIFNCPYCGSVYAVGVQQINSAL